MPVSNWCITVFSAIYLHTQKTPQSCYSPLLLQVRYRNDIIAVSDLRRQKAVQELMLSDANVFGRGDDAIFAYVPTVR